jgi:hypothetical protein
VRSGVTVQMANLVGLTSQRGRGKNLCFSPSPTAQHRPDGRSCSHTFSQRVLHDVKSEILAAKRKWWPDRVLNVRTHANFAKAAFEKRVKEPSRTKHPYRSAEGHR